MAEKSYKAACGSSITEAHYWRNVTKELLSMHSKQVVLAQHKLAKKLGMSAEEKEERVQEAVELLRKGSVSWDIAKECMDRSLAALHPDELLQFDKPKDASLTPDKMACSLVKQRLTEIPELTSL